MLSCAPAAHAPDLAPAHYLHSDDFHHTFRGRERCGPLHLVTVWLLCTSGKSGLPLSTRAGPLMATPMGGRHHSGARCQQVWLVIMWSGLQLPRWAGERQGPRQPAPPPLAFVPPGLRECLPSVRGRGRLCEGSGGVAAPGGCLLVLCMLILSGQGNCRRWPSAPVRSRCGTFAAGSLASVSPLCGGNALSLAYSASLQAVSP